MQYVIIFFIVVCVIAILIMFYEHTKIPGDFKFLEVDDAACIQGEILSKKCPIFVLRATNDEVVVKIKKIYMDESTFMSPVGAVLFNTSDFCVVSCEDDVEIKIVHPAYADKMKESEDMVYFKKVANFDSIDCDFVSITLQAGSCLVVQKNWTIACDYQKCKVSFVRGIFSKYLSFFTS